MWRCLTLQLSQCHHKTSYPDLWEGLYKLERELLTQLCHLMGSWDPLVRRGFQHFGWSEANERYVRLQNGSRVGKWHDHFYPSLFSSVSLYSLTWLSETLSLLTYKQLRPLESDGRPEAERRREAKGIPLLLVTSLRVATLESFPRFLLPTGPPVPGLWKQCLLSLSHQWGAHFALAVNFLCCAPFDVNVC